MTRIGLDSNVLIYSAGLFKVADDQAKGAAARRLITALDAVSHLHAPAQAIGELYTVLVRNGVSRDEARAEAEDAVRTFDVIPTSEVTLLSALELAAMQRLQLWDAIIVQAALAAGCELLLSEDMQDGFTIDGLTIVNPFAAPVHPKLAALLPAR